ncbi:MAG: hypothetical protein ABIO81_13785 [Ginsengibacter sp.]
MSPVFIIYILFITTTFIFSALNFFTGTIQKKKENLCLHLNLEGAAHNLIFCSQEILQDKIIGIDGIHRKIMILEKIKKKHHCYIISLDEVQNCELITSGGYLNAVNLKRFGIEENPDAVELQFDFKNYAQPVSIMFYDSLVNSKKELEFLRAKAEYWRVMFSKMLTIQVRVRA